MCRARIGRGFFVLLSLGLLSACGRHASPDATDAGPAVAVTVAHPLVEEWPVEIAVQGEVRASREVAVSALSHDAPLLSVEADVGDTVREGQVLMRLDKRFVANEIEQRRAMLAEAGANLDASRLTLARSRELATTGAISEQDILRYHTELVVSEARLAVAKLQLASSQMQGGDAVIRAPINGVVSKRSAMPGHVPASGEELFRIVSRTDCEVVANVDTELLSRLPQGASVTIYTAGLGEVAARVRAVAPSASPNRFSAQLYLQTRHECRWLPGTYVSAQVRLGMSPALSIDRSAVFARDGFQYVMVVDGHDRVHRVKVTTGRLRRDNIEILSGLGVVDRAVLAQAATLRDEALVRPASSDATASKQTVARPASAVSAQ